MLYIAGYKFVTLSDLTALKQQFLLLCQSLAIKGTILLSNEGININLAGETDSIRAFKHALKPLPAFADIEFRENLLSAIPYQRLKIKLKKEIITLRHQVEMFEHAAPKITPATFKKWLDEKPEELYILDTRNEYEVQFGTFKNAQHLALNHFHEFPKKLTLINKNKPIVMFCTGGIRCEKAGSLLLEQGFKEVYQLEGGILNYFSQVGGEHYQGGCFVFDERVTVNPKLPVIASPALNS